MIQQIDKYGQKMVQAGLAKDPLICSLDDELYWNREDDAAGELEKVMQGMNINSLICAEPDEPYRSLLLSLTRRYPQTITPGDCETRTFLHDLPVTGAFTAETMLPHLRKRKSVIVAAGEHVRVVTYGTVSPEQAFVTFSSVCFSCFVLFFSDYLADLRQGTVSNDQHRDYERLLPLTTPRVMPVPALMQGPFTRETEAIEAMIEAGRKTVDYGLVDSYFGNISYRIEDTVYISQTGSSLDELAGCIDPCPLDGSSTAGITASSELSAHTRIFLGSDRLAILHGHPKFSVILSMDCEEKNCPKRGECHIKCDRQRFINDIPIVPGEVGTGPTGLCNTLPAAIKGKRGAIVWGHGLFTAGATDFNEAFLHLLDIENMCRLEYLDRIRQTRG